MKKSILFLLLFLFSTRVFSAVQTKQYPSNTPVWVCQPSDANCGNSGSLKLDQTTPQTVINGSPIFNSGLTSKSIIDVNLNSVTGPATIIGTGLRVQGADNSLVRVATTSFGIGGMSAFASRHARGTASSPSAVQANDALVGLEGWGYGSTGYSVSPRVMIRGYAANNWTDISQDSYLSFWTSPNTTIIPAERMRITNAGNVGIGSTIPKTVFDVNGVGTFSGVKIPTIFSDTSHYTGFPNRTDTTLSFVAGASGATRTLTISGTNWKVYVNGVEYTIATTLTKQIADVTGLYWFWITAPGGVPQLNGATTGQTFGDALVATVYWNTTTDLGITSDERHWMGRDRWMHEYLHQTVGARYYDGLTGIFNNTTFSITAGEFYDEDIEHLLSSDSPMAFPGTTMTTCKVLYHDGDASWKWIDNSTTPYYAIAGVLQYNNGTTLTPVTNQKYINMWAFASAGTTIPIHILVGTAEYNTIALARAATVPSFGGLASAEMKLIYKITYKNEGGSPIYQETADYRATSVLPSAGFVPTDHSVLSKLDYASSGHTGFQSTLTNSAGLLAALSDEVGTGYAVFNGSPNFTGNVGIGTTSPSQSLEVAGKIKHSGVVLPRVLSAASYTTDTGTSLNCDNVDQFIVTAQAGALKLNNPSGTPTDGQLLFVAITGTAARALTYDTQFEASTVALPTTTVLTARLNMLFIWRADTSKWVCVAVS